jgi:hypothetical protein
MLDDDERLILEKLDIASSPVKRSREDDPSILPGGSVIHNGFSYRFKLKAVSKKTGGNTQYYDCGARKRSAPGLAKLQLKTAFATSTEVITTTSGGDSVTYP